MSNLMHNLKPNQKVQHLYNTTSKFLYVSPALRGQNGVITIVSQQVDNSSDQFMFGVSYCRIGDNFSKKIGIEHALQRLGMWWFVHSRLPFKHNEIFHHTLITLLMNPHGISQETTHRSLDMPEWAEDTIEWYLTGIEQ